MSTTKFGWGEVGRSQGKVFIRDRYGNETTMTLFGAEALITAADEPMSRMVGPEVTGKWEVVCAAGFQMKVFVLASRTTGPITTLNEQGAKSLVEVLERLVGELERVELSQSTTTQTFKNRTDGNLRGVFS